MEIEVGSYWVEKKNQLNIMKIKVTRKARPCRIIFFSAIDRGYGSGFIYNASFSVEAFLKYYRPINRLEKLVIFGEV